MRHEFDYKKMVGMLAGQTDCKLSIRPCLEFSFIKFFWDFCRIKYSSHTRCVRSLLARAEQQQSDLIDMARSELRDWISERYN